jgi:VWFA-related protein
VSRREARGETRQKALDRLAPWGGTALYDVIGRGLALLQKQGGRKGLIVFSDGEDESSRASLADAERELQASDAAMYAVGLGRGARFDTLTRLLEKLSETSGGRALVAKDAKGLPDAFREVVDDLSHSYVLSYIPTNAVRDGGWRKVSVEAPGRNYRIRSRQGYLARVAGGDGVSPR